MTEIEPNLRILIIDDNPSIHEDFRKIFRENAAEDSGLSSDEEVLFGESPEKTVFFEIDSAYQGQEGLSLVEQSLSAGHPYAVAFVDVRMPPGWDGVETIGRLWQCDPRLQTVICTAYSDYTWSEIRRKLGHSENLLILKKPFDNIEVIQLAHALCDKWRMSRQAASRMEDLEVMVARRTEEIAKARDAFRVIFEAGPIGIGLSDAEGRFIAVNRAAETMFGAPAARLSGSTPMDRGWMDEAAMAAMARKLASFGSLDAQEIQYTHPELGARTGLMWLRAVSIDHAPHVLGFYLDITDRKQMEMDLQAARAAAEAATKAKSEFLANMSHEIRTPLNGVLGLSALLEDSSVSEDVRAKLRLIRASGETLSKIVDDVLDFSKIECGRLELEEAPFSLRESLEWSLDLFRPKADEKHLRLSLAVDPAIPERLLGDATRIRQVLANLLSNATKFTDEGSVKVAARLSSAEEPSGKRRIYVSVRDTGIGIPAERIDRLFHSFSQVDASMTRRFGGSGLGLAICRRLVEMMGGSISVKSRRVEGSTFEFDFLAAVPCGEERGGTRMDAPRDLHGRILVAEDNRVNQIVIGSMLERLGCTAEFAGDGNEALRRFGESGHDLVLMDLHMPGMDGLEASRRMRDMGLHGSRVPIIALTASVSRQDREACLAAGMDDYLTKPLRLEALEQALGRWCDRPHESPSDGGEISHARAGPVE